LNQYPAKWGVTFNIDKISFGKYDQEKLKNYKILEEEGLIEMEFVKTNNKSKK